jgi:hypothetical protein
MGQEKFFEFVSRLLGSPKFRVNSAGRTVAIVAGIIGSLLLLPLSCAEAISFDSFLTNQTAESKPVTGIVANTVTGSGILGGARFLQAASNGQNRVSGDVDGNTRQYYHSQDASTTGITSLRWDGNPSPSLETSGLGGLDLIADGATGLRVIVESSDSAFGQPITVLFVLHSGNFNSSTGSFTVNSGILSATTFPIPFNTLTPTGVQGGADLKKIGAIEMFINGNTATSYDMQLSFVGTNGNCTHVPVNNFILDQCGVCNGDNSTCSDCLGVPNGTTLPGVFCPTGKLGICANGTYTGTPPKDCSCSQDKPSSVEICDELDNDCDGFIDNGSFNGLIKGTSCSVGVGACLNTGSVVCAQNGTAQCSVSPKPPSAEICDGIDNNCNGSTDEGNPTTGPRVDQCGICGGNGTTCLDCKGVPKGSATIDQCGICGGDGKSCLDCNGIPKGTAMIDQCGVCGGDGKSCLDCKGVPKGTATIDRCGICGGDGKSCLDCKGTPNGTAKVDTCGICGGDGKSCLDCNGTVNGTAKVDSCNVCGGNGTSCLDCKGTINGTATLDECGVCGGDGLSCLSCTTVDQSPTLGALDTGAKEQQTIVRKSVATLRTLRQSKRDAAFISRTLEAAQKLQIENWELSWTLPINSTTCQTSSTLCVTTSNLPILSSYRLNNERLRDLALDVMKKVATYRRGKVTKRDVRIVRAAEAQFSANLSLSQTVPEQQFSCSLGRAIVG